MSKGPYDIIVHFDDRRKAVPSQPEKTCNCIRNNQIFVHIVTRWTWNFDTASGAASTMDRKSCSQVYICIQSMHEGWLQCSLDLLSLMSWGAGGVPAVALTTLLYSSELNRLDLSDEGSTFKSEAEPSWCKNEVTSMWPSSVHNQTPWLVHHWLPHSFIFVSQQQSPPMLFIVMKRATVMQTPPHSITLDL